MTALTAIAAREEFAGVTVTALNPDHGEEDLSTLKALSRRLVSALAAKA